MKIVRELLDYTTATPGNVYVFTANNVVTYFGTPHLVMGGGAARACAKAFDNAEELFGEAIRKSVNDKGDFFYVEIPHGDNVVGALQTKYHYSQPSPINLVVESCKVFAEHASNNPDIQYHCNSPGTGLGGLDEREVFIELEKLNIPNNVTFYV
jgi:hypothetical protein